jgi:hypothetical protein
MKDVQMYQFYRKNADAINKNQVEQQRTPSLTISCVFRTKYHHYYVRGYIKSIFCQIQSENKLKLDSFSINKIVLTLSY